MEEKTGNYEKFYNLDILKSIAVTLVIMIHVVSGELDLFGKGISMKNWMIANILDTLSRMCVPLFVMVSGYLLLRKDESVGIFFKKRFIRIIPKFLIYSMIYYVFKVSFLHKPYPINENFLTLLLKGNIFYHFWYIYMILGLYTITPFLRRVVRDIHKSYIIYFIYIWTGFMVIIPFFEFIFKTKFMIYSPLGQYIGYFLIGYLIAEKPPKINKITLFSGYLISFGISVWVTYFYTVKEGKFIDFFYNYHSIAVFLQSVLFFTLIMKFTHSNEKAKEPEIIYPVRRFVSTLSVITLDVYLIHPMIISYFQDKMDIKSKMNYPVYIILMFILAMGISYSVGFIILKISKLRLNLTERKF